MPNFEPTRQAAQARLAAVQPDDYARTRNALNGAVTRLSPYLTHGFLSLPEVFAAVHARHPLHAQHKFVFELGWRAYFRHVWARLGDGIHQSLHPGLLPDDAYQYKMPVDVLEARTGIPAIDLAVRELYATGYVHNHARMWLASYLVHLRKVHWHTGGQWMLGHLLDGDVASNYLSWQWVAGTGSSKPYLFNAGNVAKFAPSDWHSPGSVLDTSYETMDRFARDTRPIISKQDARHVGSGMDEPARRVTPPPETGWSPPDSAIVSGRDVWLLHPWSLDVAPGHLPVDALRIGVGFDACHAATPWSERRWNFVTQGLRTQTENLWWGSVDHMALALQTARSVQWQSDPHVDPAFEQLHNQLSVAGLISVAPSKPLCLFDPVDVYCRSFSDWWKRTQISRAPDTRNF
ncbi:FAD-binding domain-containing protein [Polaromonas sp.]|uniref:FAD-binding domain-containing protein n=1 Tax=Polaromonas sp. TaxID=1869339 RepID=UPI0017DC542B|nr:FAD-binding domain-containing protein [Polaromonas sp.]NML85885.1 deoxyribodipyrimidine photolyase [Polaromonas sp.]